MKEFLLTAFVLVLGGAVPTQDPMVKWLAHYNQKNITASLSSVTCPQPDLGPVIGIVSDPQKEKRSYLYKLNNEEEDSLYLYRAALNWEYLGDFRKALDTMRLYVERHPFAVYFLGEVLSAIPSTLGETAQLPNRTVNDYILEYNWLVKVHPYNSDKYYQASIIRTLASTLDAFDLNEAANMWYNYTLLYTDTESVNLAWRQIKSIRDYQKEIPEDTTAFHVVTFPLQPLAAVKATLLHPAAKLNITLIPNPAQSSSTLAIDAEKSTAARIGVFDVLGTEVRSVHTGYLQEGRSEYTLDLQGLAPGSYYVRIQHRDGVETRQLVISQ